MFDTAQGFVGYMALNETDLEAMDWRIQQNKPYHMVYMKWYPTSRPKKPGWFVIYLSFTHFLV